MRYLDGSTRKQTDALGYWIDQELPNEISHLRMMSGYFALSGLGAFKNIVDAINQQSGSITAVLGSNNKETIKSDLEDYLDLVNSPRAGVKTAIVSYANGLFHPKVYHLSRTDGSSFAYVGSANLTDFGVHSGNIETGIILDSRTQDDASVLAKISASVDSWFGAGNLAVKEINDHADVSALTASGIVGTKRQAPQGGGNGGTGGGKQPSLQPVLNLGQKLKSKTKQASGSTNPSTTSNIPVPGTSNEPGPASSPPTATSAQEILIAEIGAGVRWKQANFPFETMNSYFGVNPLSGGTVNLNEIDAAGVISDTIKTPVVHVQSKNYRIELRSVSGTPYPTSGRPIGVFRRVAVREFNYRVIMPGTLGHANLQTFLDTNYAGAARQLKRVTTTSSVLSSVWPTCPV